MGGLRSLRSKFKGRKLEGQTIGGDRYIGRENSYTHPALPPQNWFLRWGRGPAARGVRLFRCAGSKRNSLIWLARARRVRYYMAETNRKHLGAACILNSGSRRRFIAVAKLKTQEPRVHPRLFNLGANHPFLVTRLTVVSLHLHLRAGKPFAVSPQFLQAAPWTPVGHEAYAIL